MCGQCKECEICQDGACAGCEGCNPTSEGKIVFKIDFLEYGKGGHPGEALDIDGDPESCAPTGQCEAGLDNQFTLLFDALKDFFDVDAELAGSLKTGDLVLLLEAPGFNMDGNDFLLHLYYGQPAADKETCDYQRFDPS